MLDPVESAGRLLHRNVSRRVGRRFPYVRRGDHKELSSSIRVSFTFSVLLGLVLPVLGILLTPQLVRLSAAPPEVYAEAVVYLRIYLAGLMLTVIYNIGAGILRRSGIPAILS